MIRRIFIIVAAFLLVTVTSALVYAGDTVRIAIANNFSKYATQCADPLGKHFRNSIDLAINNFVKANSKLGYQIIIDVYDYGESDVKIVDIMDEIDKSGAVAVIGFPCSDQALLAAKIAEQKGIVFVSFEATSDHLWDYGNYVFKTCFKNSYQGGIVANYAYTDLKKRNMAIIASSDCEYCTNMASYFQKQFVAAGGNIVKKYNILKSDSNYDSIIGDVRNLNIDGIFVANHEFVTSKIISQLVNSGYRTSYFSGDDMGNVEGMLFKLLKDKEFELYSVAHWFYNPNDGSSRVFREKFHKEYGLYPNDNSALAYDGMMFLLEGINKAKYKTRASLRDSLAQVRYFHGLRNISFDPISKSTGVSLYLLRSEKNKFVLVRRVDP